jgi:CDP-glycerol glycerophosphotransferase (TagB/SpsB family)
VAPLTRRRRSAVSVVVAVTDGNAPFLGECLAALSGQTRPPDEVLLAVTGTGADTAASVTAALASADGSVTAVEGDLDEGVRRATGDLLMLVEAGDLLVPRALEALAGTLEETGSDLALPGAAGCAPCTLADAPQAAAAVDLATIMMRTTFWREAGLESVRDPLAGWLPAVHAVVLASAFDVVAGPLRRGPRRGTGFAFGAMPGIAPHLPRLLRAVEELLTRLDVPGRQAAREHLAHWLLSEEVARYLDDAERCDPATWAQLVDFVRRLLGSLPAERVAAVPVESRVRAWLAAQDRRGDLETFNAARWHEEGDYATRVEDGVVLAVLPLNDTADVPDEVLRLSDEETPLVTQLRRARWTEDGRLELEVVAFVRSVGAEAGPAQARLAVVGESGRRVELDVTQLHAPEVDLIAGEPHHGHADGLFSARVDPALLAGAGPAAWSIEVSWERAGVQRSGTVREVERRGSVAALAPGPAGDLEVRIDPSSAQLVCAPPRPAEPDLGHPAVTGLALDGDVLVVTGTAGAGHRVLRLRGPRGSSQTRLAVVGGTFTARLPLRHDPWALGETPLTPGSYRLRVQGAETLLLGAELAARTPYVERSSVFRVRVERNPDGSAQLQLLPPLADDEAGSRAQHELRRWYATDEQRLDPGTVYLQSYAGLSATDSPLAIHHELRRTRPGLRLVWGAADASVLLPEGAERLLLRSREWYAELARCGHIVTNVDMDDWFRKRPGQRLLQTYHGYPAKAMGVMAWEAKNFTPSLIERHLRRTSATWDLLLTPHPAMDVHYREQYRYTGPILSAGYPRDDQLVGPDAERLREDTRRRLGIGDRTAVLYAPTWRDDLTTNFRAAVMPSTFDVDTAAEALGEDYVILLRGHRFHRQRPEVRGRLVDVTSYPEINHLVLAADVAVLDYSSLRFDVALARRPMVFLVPDLDRYEHGVRGFLYDFRSSAPGPLLDTTAEVVDALRDLDGTVRSHRDDVDRFNAQFNPLQDGHAAERVVAAFFR